jgi:hypothetical protein
MTKSPRLLQVDLFYSSRLEVQFDLPMMQNPAPPRAAVGEALDALAKRGSKTAGIGGSNISADSGGIGLVSAQFSNAPSLANTAEQGVPTLHQKQSEG